MKTVFLFLFLLFAATYLQAQATADSTTTTTGATNDTFDVRIATVTGNSTTTMHRYGFILERIY